MESGSDGPALPKRIQVEVWAISTYQVCCRVILHVKG
jgi:hypothetical protein